LIGAAMFNGSGTPLSWVSNHRDHHAHSDTLEDVSSPRHGGFWWTHLRWLWQTPGASPEQYAPDLLRRRMQRWSKWQVPMLAARRSDGSR
jgi:stearoyl-CoA desaturase (delta-9 desaturase)